MKKNNKNLLSISGKIGSGKDLLGKIFQALLDKPTAFDKMDVVTEEDIEYYIWDRPKYEVKKFADKLKDMVCILLDCTREQLENREFKEKELGEEWWYYTVSYRCAPNETEGGLFVTKEKALEYYYSIGGKKDELDLDIIKTVKLTPRLLLQLLGTQCGRDILHPNIWCNALMNKYKSHLDIKHKLAGEEVNENYEPHEDDIIDIYPNWIITDTRFPNEFEAVKSRGGACIKIERDKPCHVCGTTKYERRGRTCEKISCPSGQPLHESETALDDQTFDYVFLNNGSIKDLVEAAKKFLKDYKYIK